MSWLQEFIRNLPEEDYQVYKASDAEERERYSYSPYAVRTGNHFDRIAELVKRFKGFDD